MFGFAAADVDQRWMTIHSRSVGGITILDLEGRLTVHGGAATLHDAVRRLTSLGLVNLLINLQSVSYIDGTALCELVWACTIVGQQGGALKLLKPTTRFRNLLEAMRLSSAFEIYDVEELAVESFAPRARAEQPRPIARRPEL